MMHKYDHLRLAQKKYNNDIDEIWKKINKQMQMDSRKIFSASDLSG
jgi:hypothetical protein